MPVERPTQTDQSIHVTKGEAAFAVVCGTLVGLGVAFPVVGGIGAIAGIVGATRVHGRETKEKVKRVARYKSEAIRPPGRTLGEEVLGFFDEPGVVR